MRKIILSSKIISEVIKDYQSGSSLKKIGKKFNVSGEYIRSLLNKNNIQLRTYLEINRKHSVNDNYFSVIDTQEKAYFLGLLYSDGSVSSSSNAIILKLQEKDRDMLVKLSHIIMNKEKLYKSENNYVLKFSSRSIKNDLIRLGCMPNKTFKIEFPNIDKSLYNHFIRGYFDGDGSIYSYEKDYCANIIATEKFCNSVNQIIFKQFGIACVINKDDAINGATNIITSSMTYKGNRRVEVIMNWLYQDATIYLERKYDKYLELKQIIKQVDDKHGNRYKQIRLDEHI